MARFTGVQNNITNGNVEIDGLNLYVSGTITFDATEDGIGGQNLVHLIPGPGVIITSGSAGYAITASGGGANVFTSSLSNEPVLVSSSISNWYFTGSAVNVEQSGSD
jgi:hypothetical protein